jgi:hypothetical protein
MFRLIKPFTLGSQGVHLNLGLLSFSERKSRMLHLGRASYHLLYSFHYCSILNLGLNQFEFLRTLDFLAKL